MGFELFQTPKRWFAIERFTRQDTLGVTKGALNSRLSTIITLAADALSVENKASCTTQWRARKEGHGCYCIVRLSNLWENSFLFLPSTQY